MEILVTGASGYIGGKLADKLLEQGHTVYSIISNNKHKNVKYISIDDIYNYDFDIIYHLAAYPDKHNVESVNVIKTIESNILLTTKVMCYARDKNIQMISASSFSQYLDNTPYAISKRVSEELAKSINYDKATFIRFTDTYGEDDTRKKVYNLIKDAIKCNTTIELSSPEHYYINFTHVDDIVKALLYLEENKLYGTYDLIYEETLTTLGIMAKYIDPSGKHYKFKSNDIVPYLVPTNKNRIPGFKLERGNCFA